VCDRHHRIRASRSRVAHRARECRDSLYPDIGGSAASRRDGRLGRWGTTRRRRSESRLRGSDGALEHCDRSRARPPHRSADLRRAAGGGAFAARP
jgi:hypothetical protein